MATTYAALVSLLHIADQIQRHVNLLLSLDKDLIESLYNKVCFLVDFLESNSYRELKLLECRISDAAYAAKDIIEAHLLNFIIAIPTGQSPQTPDLSFPSLQTVIQEMDFIKEELMEIQIDRGIQHLQLSGVSRNYIPFVENTMVGLGDELVEIMERLVGRKPSRQIIPIVGMAGIGKTTLARNVYENPVVVEYFDFRAWVSISQEYSSIQILSQILVLLFGELEDGSDRSEAYLGECVYKRLSGMRYLVILDDMWDVEAWEVVRLFFPDNNTGSRIIVTTRLSSVASHFGSHGVKMNLLDEDTAFCLFSKIVFAQEACPVGLQGIGEEIVRNCKGLPLSITVVGGLLARSDRTKQYWEYVARNTNSIISSEDNEHCVKILSLSYHSLPIYLKPCFLYMAAFPVDKPIYASLLISMWVAEGFLKPNQSKDLEMVGEEYLNDLISRNLIFVHESGSGGKVKSCQIHDLLRDLCLREARKEKFLCVLDMHSLHTGQGINSERRISIHQSSSKEEDHSHVLGTLKQGSILRSLICNFDGVLSLERFMLLRVLKVDAIESNVEEEREFRYMLDDMFQLVNSHSIELNAFWDFSSNLPSPLSLVWNLQTLIVKGTWRETIAASEVWEMTELRHLKLDRLYLPDPSSRQTEMRDCVALENLQTLAEIVDFRCSHEVVKRIPNIKKLRISYESVTDGFKEFCLKNLALLKKLESLACCFNLEETPCRTDLLSNLALPRSLKKLTLSGCNLHWEDMSKFGSLPHLQVLKLKSDAFKGPEWIPVEGEFCHLKFLKIEFCWELMQWMAENTHFPRLERLVLIGLFKLVEIPSSIGDIPTLKVIQLVSCSKSADNSAKMILEEQEDLGNVGLELRFGS